VRNSKKTWLIALLVALLPCVAGAAGLGRLNVLSALGHPLIAEIELVSVTKEELGSLSARLAHPDVYRNANLQYNPALTGARATIERRPNGVHFIKIISTRPVNEPFIDLLVELTWSSGRLSREYTALLDPPGTAPAPAPVISAAPESRPAPAPAADPQPKAKPDRASRPVTPAAPIAGGKEYGPIQRGETLGKIAKEVMPEGVTLEQMLVALYRNNSDAFINKNLNLVRTGKILRVPDREEVAAITRGEATKEYRTHVADWNSYRERVADSAGKAPADGRTAVSGKITTKVEDKGAGGAAKDVVRLSKGEKPGAADGKGKPRSSADRIRALEEEAVAREKALKDANERVTQLEKTIQDMKKLAELKSPGMAAAQQQAEKAAAAKPDAKAAPKPEAKAVAKPEPAKPEAKKPDAVAAVKPEPAKPEAAKPEAMKPEAAKPAPAPMDKPAADKPEPQKPAQVAVPEPKKDTPAPKPAPKKAAPPPEPDLMDEILEAATDPLYLGIGGGILALGIAAFVMARRRRNRRDDHETQVPPRLGKAAAAAAGAAAVTSDTTAAQEPRVAAGATSEDVDPLAEAEVYIAYGRDGQAEEILKDALAKNPKREDVQLKLLEIYAARKDKAAFGKVAGELNKQTGGAGDTWLKAAAMGYALDAANPMYAAGKDAVAAAPASPGTADVDLDLGLGEAGTTTDITLDAGAADAAAGTDTGILDLGAADEKPGAAPAPDFTLEVPAAEPTPVEAPAPAADSNMMDFQIDLPKAGEDVPTRAAAPTAAAGTDSGLDFKLDDINLDDAKAEAPAGGEKDGHWYDVQTKFDLAKAYQEMGDKDGAKEILQEVIKEGDAEQKAQAKNLMDSLG
jgi:pilus assembly protein FimV